MEAASYSQACSTHFEFYRSKAKIRDCKLQTTG